MRNVPRLNIGALMLPPIWGPAHGFWITILFYPAWLFADNSFYAAYTNPSPLSIGLALAVFAILLGLTVAFAVVSQPFAAHRAVARGMSKEAYLRRERAWAVACALVGLALIGGATYFNLFMRAGMGL